MVFAIVLVLLVAGSLVFHVASPWWVPPLASNWGRMDDMLGLTFLVTGVFFVALNLFLAWTLWRHARWPGGAVRRAAAYRPDHPRLERALIGVTALGIAALLAPGLVVYADYVRPPPDALVVEVLGQQWRWSYRFAGTDGRLAGADPRFVTPANPFGLDPRDPAGAGNRLIASGELHLPLGRPVRLLLRSNDVLHDFDVPPLRARMNIVPGTVTSFWFTPMKAGRYEAMCAQLCGVGHAQMRSVMVVEPPADFERWLAAQPNFGSAP